LSRSGTTLATFTVAGWVRRGLESQGYKIQKVTGYGCKNEMLAGIFEGSLVK
jgi:tRNA 5-methylaminomethyl-2-thiouridine biosynthesis bifunctional protein